MGLLNCAIVLVSCINLSKPIQTHKGYLSRSTIVQYDRAIALAGQKYDISPFLLVGILKVESDMGTVTASRTSDYGPMQINSWWLPRLRLTRREVERPRMAMLVAAKILNYSRIQYGTQKCWWSSYNSHTPRHRRVYERYVFKALGKMGFEANCYSPYLNSWKSSAYMTDRLERKLAAK